MRIPTSKHPIARWYAVGAIALGAAVAAISCAGPQPLRLAIRPTDEQGYVKNLDAFNGDAVTAFAHWMASERGSTPAALLHDDKELSTTSNPFDAHADPVAVSRGAVVYKVHCARCHGEDARGKGPSTLPGHPAPDFQSFGNRFAATLHRGAPHKWFRVIRDGSGDVVDYPDGPSTAMPAFRDKLAREQIWLAITYLQSLDMHLSEHDQADQKGTVQ